MVSANLGLIVLTKLGKCKKHNRPILAKTDKKRCLDKNSTQILHRTP